MAKPQYLIENEIDGSLLLLVPGGKFLAGEDKFAVEIPAYYLGIHPVTNAQYKRFVDVTGHRPPDKADYGEPIWSGKRFPSEKADHPVVCVSWDDAQDFIGKLNKREREASRLPAGWEYRLPTEAEWEYACRAANQTAYSFGNDAGSLGDYAWYNGNSGKQTHDVGSKRANAWGLHDMHGNVWEWCQDWYYDGNDESVTDPKGAAAGSYRVYRGGSWINSSEGCRSALRSGFSPSLRSYFLSFRLVMAGQ